MRNSKAKGFTLIELIVVMAIIGVLAAILVPSMIGYLNDSKYSKANANAKQVYQSAANWCTKCETNNHPVGGKAALDSGDVTLTTQVDGNKVVFDATKEDLARALQVYMGGNPNSGIGCTSITKSAPTFGQWKGGAEESIFGEYPTEMNANKVEVKKAAWGKSNAEKADPKT